MATQFDPIAKDESLNTTEQTPRNIADVLAEELSALTQQLSTPDNLTDLDDVNTGILADGQTLVWDATNQKWTNGNKMNTDGSNADSRVSFKSLSLSGTFNQGYNNSGTGAYYHVEGYMTTVSNNGHAEGYKTRATQYGHAEGGYTTAQGYSHAEGYGNNSFGAYSHSEGKNSYAVSEESHAEGIGTTAGSDSTSLYMQRQATHAEGGYTCAEMDYSHAEGYRTKVTEPHFAAHAEGTNNVNNYYATERYISSTYSTPRDMIDIYAHKKRDVNIDFYGAKRKQFVHFVGAGTTDTSQADNCMSMDYAGNMFLQGSPFFRRGIVDGVLVANSRHNYVLEDGAVYLLICHAHLKSTGAYRGMNTYIIGSNYDKGATTTAQAVARVASVNAHGTVGVVLEGTQRMTAFTYTDPGTGTTSTRYHAGIGIGSCTTDCRVRYSFLKVLGSYDDFYSNDDINLD